MDTSSPTTDAAHETVGATISTPAICRLITKRLVLIREILIPGKIDGRDQGLTDGMIDGCTYGDVMALD